jgi:dTDP-4-dehydrorhamnose 3,5-epimerase
LKFLPTPFDGAFVVELARIEDERGFFARSFCEEEFRAHGLNPAVTQCNISWNRRKATLRGLHFQAKPHEEAKLVRCTRGAIWDVIVDLRDDSPTRLRWHAVELSADNRLGVYVPEGFAHGFQTLTDDSEVLYQMSESFQPGFSRGLLWNDPKLGIAWPLPDPILSERDRSYAPLP